MDWLCKALSLPKHFLSKSKGGGTIQSSATECIFNCILAARAYGIKKLRGCDSRSHDSDFLPKLVAYCSEESHICVDRSTNLAMLNLRILKTDDKCVLRGETVRKAIEEDLRKGLMPIFLTCTLGQRWFARPPVQGMERRSELQSTKQRPRRWRGSNV